MGAGDQSLLAASSLTSARYGQDVWVQWAACRLIPFQTYQQLLHGALCCSGGTGIFSCHTAACRFRAACAAALQLCDQQQRLLLLPSPASRHRRWRLQIPATYIRAACQALLLIWTMAQQQGAAQSSTSTAAPDTHLTRCIAASHVPSGSTAVRVGIAGFRTTASMSQTARVPAIVVSQSSSS